MADDLVLTLRNEAVEFITPVSAAVAMERAADEIERLRAEVARLQHDNRILEIKNRGTLANNLCPDHRDKQQGKPCLACTIETLERKAGKAERELAELRERIEKAPVEDDFGNSIMHVPEDLIGHSVRLVRED